VKRLTITWWLSVATVASLLFLPGITAIDDPDCQDQDDFQNCLQDG